MRKWVFLLSFFGLAACQTTEVKVVPTKGQRDAAEQLDMSKLKPRLRGKSQRAILKMLGQPNGVYENGGRVKWLYVNAAYDPESLRAVNFLKLEFVENAVDKIEYTLAPAVW